jgi:hypothetical protein
VEWNNAGLTAVGTWNLTNLGRIQVYNASIPLPGQLTGTFTQATDTATSTSTTTSTFVATSTTGAISPTSWANLVKATAVGAIYFTGATGTTCNAQLARSASAATNLFGPETYNYGNPTITGLGTPSTNIGYDRPNSTGSVTYTLQLKRFAGTATCWWGDGTGQAVLILEEIMG